MSFRKVVSIGLSALLVWLPAAPLRASLPGGQSPGGNDVHTEMDRLFNAAEVARSEIDRTAFDLDAVLDAADYDAENLVEFVRNEVIFEPYLGVLRGPQGTLMSRAGNAADQAVLLAKLLRDAGFDARIARTTLTTQQAQTLLDENITPRPAADTANVASVIVSLLKNTGNYDRLDPAAKEALSTSHTDNFDPAEYANYSELLAVSAELGEMLEISTGKSSSALTETVVEEARDYFWVQARELSSEDWRDIHPVLQEGNTIEVTANAYFAEQVPEELLHRFRFQVFIEKLQNGVLTSMPVMAPWERPTANLNAVPIEFANAPDNMLANPTATFQSTSFLENARWFVPLFNNALPEQASFFDTRGTLIDPMAASSASAGIFATVGDLFGDALGQFDQKALPVLTGQWLEFTLIAPDGSEKIYRRTTIDRIGPAARRSGKVGDKDVSLSPDELAPLVQRHSFMLANGSIPNELVLDYALQQLLDSRPVVDALIRQSENNPLKPEQFEKLLSEVPSAWAGHLSMFLHLDQAETLNRKHLLYRPAPTLVVQREGLTSGGGMISAVDIVQNPRRSIAAIENGKAALDPADVMKAGVWDTFVEGDQLPPATSRFNTMQAMADAVAAGAKKRVVRDESDLRALRVDDNTRASMQSDLERGAVLVVADYAQEGPAGWWRVDPLTGDTVGQIADGRGSESVEYLKVMGLGISMLSLTISLGNCVSRYNPKSSAEDVRELVSLSCCSLMSGAMFAFGMALSAVAEGLAGLKLLGQLGVNSNYASIAARAGVSTGAGWDTAGTFLFDPTLLCEPSWAR
ncbi:hypothetical protein [Haliea sp. E17]|uniref:hypothetical protein n=1 Tax=Haliea sp. E17 TaxID=3401576 RepID=UPI003AAC2FB4